MCIFICIYIYIYYMYICLYRLVEERLDPDLDLRNRLISETLVMYVETLMICKCGFNHSQYTFALKLLTKIVLFSKLQ